MSSRELITDSVPALAGTLHLPASRPLATVLMVPGSGPSDRDNDVYFPPIRAGLLSAGIAVASFDKRGVGGSAGDWHETDPDRQAADVAAQAACVAQAAGVDGSTLGLFGHSQGGWVVLDVAAADPTIAFVVTNSGPGVSWATQGRYATEAGLIDGGADREAIERSLAAYDEVVELIRDGADVDAIQGALAAGPPVPGAPTDPAELALSRAWLDHDPRDSIGRITCPLLALFGSADRLVPVHESVAVFREARAGQPGALTVEIVPGADHRLRTGDPPTLHAGYGTFLTDWILRVVAL